MNSSVSSAVTTVYIVDDDASIRKTLLYMLREAGYEASAFASAGEFLLTPPAERRGCVLLDANMPHPDGFELFEALQQRGVNLPVIFITGSADFSQCVRAMKAGAVDFLIKPLERDVLLRAVESALVCREEVDEQRARIGSLRLRLTRLTPRERQVLLAILTGRLNKQIADELGAALRTIKAHRANVMAKMEARSLAELVEMGHELRDSGVLAWHFPQHSTST